MKKLFLFTLLVVGCQNHFISDRMFTQAQKTCENHGGLMGLQTQADTCMLHVYCKDWMKTVVDNCTEDRLYPAR